MHFCFLYYDLDMFLFMLLVNSNFISLLSKSFADFLLSCLHQNN